MVNKFKLNRYYKLHSFTTETVYYLIRTGYDRLRFISVSETTGAHSVINFDKEWCKRNMESIPLVTSILRYKL